MGFSDGEDLYWELNENITNKIMELARQSNYATRDDKVKIEFAISILEDLLK